MKFKINELKKPDKSIIPIKYLDIREPEVLTDDYVAELNREMAYRIRESEDKNMAPLEDMAMYPLRGTLEVKEKTRKLIR